MVNNCVINKQGITFIIVLNGRKVALVFWLYYFLCVLISSTMIQVFDLNSQANQKKLIRLDILTKLDSDNRVT